MSREGDFRPIIISAIAERGIWFLFEGVDEFVSDGEAMIETRRVTDLYLRMTHALQIVQSENANEINSKLWC